MNTSAMLKQPAAYLPMALSLAAPALVVGHVAVYGVTRGGDEGPAAHIFQLLLVAEMPIMAYFAIKWLPRAPKPALVVLLLQVGAALAALAPVFILDY